MTYNIVLYVYSLRFVPGAILFICSLYGSSSHTILQIDLVQSSFFGHNKVLYYTITMLKSKEIVL
jgi:hypothetical protein